MVMRNAFKPFSYSCVVVLAIFGENSRPPGVTIIFFQFAAAYSVIGGCAHNGGHKAKYKHESLNRLNKKR